MTPYKLFLDDYRAPEMVTWVDMPPGPWVIVKDFWEFKQAIEDRGMPEFIAYDHDLADIHYVGNGYDHERTGLHCAEYAVLRCMEFDIDHPPYVVHSMNPVGATRIRNTIEDYNRDR